MADFCRACSIDHFGRDYGDLRGLGPKCEEGYGYPVICEGCGFVLVDHLGNCFRCDLMKGKPGHDGQNLRPLKGGRRWPNWFTFEFFKSVEDDMIELGAPLWDHLDVIQVTHWRFGHRRLERKLSRAEYPQWGIFGRYVIELGAPL